MTIHVLKANLHLWDVLISLNDVSTLNLRLPECGCIQARFSMTGAYNLVRGVLVEESIPGWFQLSSVIGSERWSKSCRLLGVTHSTRRLS